MSWYVLGATASVYVKDKAADWTEGSRFEPYTSQWDNPEWYDYVAAAASAYAGGAGGSYGNYVNAAGKIAKGVGEYNDDEDWDYRQGLGTAASIYGDFGGYGSNTDIWKYGQKALQYLPDNRDEVEASATIGTPEGTAEYGSYYYKPDLATDMYKSGNPNTSFEFAWDKNPMYKESDKEGVSPDSTFQSNMADTTPMSSTGAIAGGIIDVVLGRDFNERPNDPYWIHDEGMGTNAQTGGASSPGWFDKMFD